MFYLLALLKYWLFALFALVRRALSGLEREDALGTRLHPFATFFASSINPRMTCLTGVRSLLTQIC